MEIEPVCADSLRVLFPKVIGNGSFGVVYQAKLCETGEMVAIKKVLQDKRFKNRELQVITFPWGYTGWVNVGGCLPLDVKICNFGGVLSFLAAS